MKYGFIGLGNMGHFMAKHCIDAGYEMIVSSNTVYQKSLMKWWKKVRLKRILMLEIGKVQKECFYVCLMKILWKR